jgi:ATP-dependent Clp protease ATP-binding subunit ClpC
MGARPLRRAIQRYIEDPLADEVLAQNAPPGSTVEVDRAPVGGPDDGSEDVQITITAPKEPKREPVGVGAKGEEAESGGEGDGSPAPEGSSLPDEPEVLPEIPDAPPAPEDEGNDDS